MTPVALAGLAVLGALTLFGGRKSDRTLRVKLVGVVCAEPVDVGGWFAPTPGMLDVAHVLPIPTAPCSWPSTQVRRDRPPVDVARKLGWTPAGVFGSNVTFRDANGTTIEPEDCVDEYGRRWPACPGRAPLNDILDTVGSTLEAVGEHAAFVPGVGTVVGAGIAGLAAVGRGESLANVAVKAARGAIPPGPQRAAFDVGVACARSGCERDKVRDALERQLGAENGAAFAAGLAA